MIPVWQQVRSRVEGESDSLFACLASILDLDIEDVPHAGEDALREWLATIGLTDYRMDGAEFAGGAWIPPGRSIVTFSPKFGESHSVVYFDREPSFDPWPWCDDPTDPTWMIVETIVLVARDPAVLARALPRLSAPIADDLRPYFAVAW